MALFTRITTRIWRLFGWVLREFVGSYTIALNLFFVGIASTDGLVLVAQSLDVLGYQIKPPLTSGYMIFWWCHVCASCAKILAALEGRRWRPLGFVNSCEMYVIVQTKWRWNEGSRVRKQVYGLLVELDSYFNLNERNRKFDFIC